MSNQKSEIKVGLILSYINLIIGNLIPLFYTPIMLSILGQSEYGLYKLASSVSSYLSLLAFGIGGAVSRYLIKARVEEGKEAEERMFGLFHLLFQVISVVTIIVGIFGVLNLELLYAKSLSETELFEMKVLVMILVLNTAVNFSVSAYSAVVTSHEKFLFLQTVNILSTIVMPLANLVALYMGFASRGMVISSLIISVLIRFLYVYYVQKKMDLKPVYRNLPVNNLKEILGFSFWVFVANIVSQLYNSTDVMIIGAIPGLATVGVAVYSAGAVFNNIVFSLALASSNLFTPRANLLVFEKADREQLTDFMIKIGRLQCYIIMLIVSGFTVFGKSFITWYIGAEYLDAYWVALLMMVPSCVPLMQSVALSITQARNQHRFRSIVYLLIAIANVVGTYILVHSSGIIGAAFMTGFANIIGQGLIMNWFYWKKMDLDIPRFWKNMIKIISITIILCSITFNICKVVNLDNIAIFMASVIIYTFIYFVMHWMITMEDDEKWMIRNVLRLKK